jgi:uncharacterized protein YbjT (DUF2867 family)
MQRVLVAGATGGLGRAVLDELKGRGYITRALVRDAGRLGDARASADEIFTADATMRETLKGACERVDVVFSSLGAPLNVRLSKERRSYDDVDYQANRNLLDESLKSGVRKFVYVSVFGAERLGELEYPSAHSRFAHDLKYSGIEHTIVQPTGFFSAFGEILKIAKNGKVASIGSGEARTNPIHEQDLAKVCADAIESSQKEIPSGGPEVLTRKEIIELAFKALTKKPRIIKAPASVMKVLIWPTKLFDRRLHALMRFLIAVSEIDVVAPAYGHRRLYDYFRELANEGCDPMKIAEAEQREGIEVR